MSAVDSKLSSASSDDLSGPLKALGVRSPAPDAAAAAGIKTTEALSAAGCADLEQHCGVSLCTVIEKNGSEHLYILYGVFFQELPVVEHAEVLRVGARYHRVDKDFAFCVYSADEFVADVCQQGNGTLYWPRTKRFYRIPPWYQAKIALGVADVRRAASLPLRIKNIL